MAVLESVEGFAGFGAGGFGEGESGEEFAVAAEVAGEAVGFIGRSVGGGVPTGSAEGPAGVVVVEVESAAGEIGDGEAGVSGGGEGFEEGAGEGVKGGGGEGGEGLAGFGVQLDEGLAVVEAGVRG